MRAEALTEGTAPERHGCAERHGLSTTFTQSSCFLLNIS